MVKYTGINHLAMATADIDMTIRFWRDLLGMRLVAGLGRPGYRHYFFEISDHDMIAFFEGRSCFSRNLAAYFGEHLEKERCGHCSFCKNERIVLETTRRLKPLADLDCHELTGPFCQAAGDLATQTNITKFLCGIYTPCFSKFKVKAMPGFGALELYPFQEVKKWVQAEQENSL